MRSLTHHILCPAWTVYFISQIALTRLGYWPESYVWYNIFSILTFEPTWNPTELYSQFINVYIC